jgi:hypothetical protein|nr:DUF29 family protein [Microcystis aeruginosa]
MLGRIISANLKLSHLSSLGISILQFILISAKKAPEQVQSLIEQTRQQVVDPNNQINVIELIEKIIIYKFPHHETAIRWRQSIMLGVHALKQLYELDDSQWLEETVSLLRNHQFQQLDLEHLIEKLSREAQLFVGWVSALRNIIGRWVSCFNRSAKAHGRSPTYVHLIFNSTHPLTVAD